MAPMRRNGVGAQDEIKEDSVSERTRVGVVGCGLIAEVMHLPYLAELADRFDRGSVRLVGAGGRRMRAPLCVPRVRTRWQGLLTQAWSR